MSLTRDPFPAYFAALEARHARELTFAEIRRALQALSSLYVERRSRLGAGRALEGAGKRAAFALYYGPLHFLLVREIVRRLQPALPPAPRILDLGCGTGVAGAAWALEQSPPAEVLALDESGWAVAEATFTLRQLGLPGRASKGDAASAAFPAPPAGIVGAFTVNELDPPARDRLLPRLLEAARRGSSLLIVEPIALGVSPWWPAWREAFRAAGGREDEWRVRAVLPERLALLGKAAGLSSARELRGRSLALAQRGSARS
jgi:SAM-dependent methyltransferase